jgi:hypothetical protein
MTKEMDRQEPVATSTAFERIGGMVLLIVLAAMSGSAGVVALMTGSLTEGGSRGAPRLTWEWHGIAAHAGGMFLLLVSATLLELALSGLRLRRTLLVLLVIDAAVFIVALAARIAG